MKLILIVFCVLFAGLIKTSAQQNLIPNFNFADPTPLKGWRVDFPYQDWYKKNVTYVKQTDIAGKRCAVIDLPPGIAGNEGGKIETALVPCESGATYRAEVEAYLPDFSAKVHAEVFAANPRPELAAPPDPNAKNPNNSIFRIPEGEGHPALIMIYRKQFPDPPKGAKWSKVETTFTVPMEWDVNLGKDANNRSVYKKVKPAYMSLKAYTYEATMGAGKAYFTDFKLFKTKGPDASAPPKGGLAR
jgi:hypothetical protein